MTAPHKNWTKAQTKRMRVKVVERFMELEMDPVSDLCVDLWTCMCEGKTMIALDRQMTVVTVDRDIGQIVKSP